MAGGAVPRFLGARLGRISGTDGVLVEIDATLETTPSVLYDALVVPDGAGSSPSLNADGRTLEFLKDQYRHCKPILLAGSAVELLPKAGIDRAGARKDAGLIVSATGDDATAAFITALAAHRHFARETDPPRI
jgi:catalase